MCGRGVRRIIDAPSPLFYPRAACSSHMHELMPMGRLCLAQVSSFCLRCHHLSGGSSCTLVWSEELSLSPRC